MSMFMAAAPTALCSGCCSLFPVSVSTSVARGCCLPATHTSAHSSCRTYAFCVLFFFTFFLHFVLFFVTPGTRAAHGRRPGPKRDERAPLPLRVPGIARSPEPLPGRPQWRVEREPVPLPEPWERLRQGPGGNPGAPNRVCICVCVSVCERVCFGGGGRGIFQQRPRLPAGQWKHVSFCVHALDRVCVCVRQAAPACERDFPTAISFLFFVRDSSRYGICVHSRSFRFFFTVVLSLAFSVFVYACVCVCLLLMAAGTCGRDGGVPRLPERVGVHLPRREPKSGVRAVFQDR